MCFLRKKRIEMAQGELKRMTGPAFSTGQTSRQFERERTQVGHVLVAKIGQSDQTVCLTNRRPQMTSGAHQASARKIACLIQ